MRSSIEIVARRRGPGTVLTRLRAGGHFALRQTGPAVVHLVGTAAGPLGGDGIEITVDVGAGAALEMLSAAATIVLPGAEDPASAISTGIDVADGGLLDLALEPVVVCAAAVHTASTSVRLAGSGRVRLREQVVLGRAGEAPGRWTGRMSATRDGVPLLRHTVDSDLLAGDGVRVIVTALDTGPADPGAAQTARQAVSLPLAAGGTLATALGPDLLSALRDLDAVSGRDGLGERADTRAAPRPARR